MKNIKEFPIIYLHKEAVDMRKSINGLAAIVEKDLGINLFQEAVFAFSNRYRDVVKILYWDKSGFALWYKRLEKEKFIWTKHLSGAVIELSSHQMSWLLEEI